MQFSSFRFFFFFFSFSQVFFPTYNTTLQAPIHVLQFQKVLAHVLTYLLPCLQTHGALDALTAGSSEVGAKEGPALGAPSIPRIASAKPAIAATTAP
jgi:hypothetical protein